MGAMLPSEMSYIRANLNDCSEIWLIWRLADDELRDFHSLILAGLKPRTATVSFISNDYLHYGWEPDGSGMTWNNEKFPSVQIERVEFQFDLKEPALGLSPPISPSGEIIRGMAAIELGIRNLSWGVWLIAALLLGLAVKLGWF